MTLRGILLRAMLWSLAFAALTGVAAVLFGGGYLISQVIGTGVVTAAACGVMLPMAGLIDRTKTRSAGLLGMAMVCAEFLMALMLIWDVAKPLLGWRGEGHVGETMAILGLGVLGAMGLMGLLPQRRTVVAARTGLVVVVAAAAAFLLATWGPRWGLPEQECWETGGAILSLGMLAVVALGGVGSDKGRHWRWVGVMASAAALAMWLTDIWMGVGSDPGFVAWCVLISVAVVVAHANLALNTPLAPHQRWILAVAIGATMVTAVLFDLLIAEEKLGPSRFYTHTFERILAAAAIVASCGSLALCVLARMNRRVEFEPVMAELVNVVVICPRCRRKQQVHVGGAVCSGCGLRITISVEEPRCPTCEYLLYGLTSDRCPECGSPIAGDQQCGVDRTEISAISEPNKYGADEDTDQR